MIVDAVDRLPTDTDVRERGEVFLLDAATRLNATDLAKAAKHLVEVADPEAAERKAEKDLERQDRAAHHHRFLAITEDGAGGIRLRGRGTVEDAAVIKAALLPLTKPQPSLDPDHPECDADVDPRDHGARLWDALVATCDHALSTDLPPDSHGARPRVAVTTSLDVLQGKIDWATLGAHVSTTDDGLELIPSVVRRLACDADLIPIVLGTTGEVLDVGRTAPAGHPGDLAGPGLPRPALHLPRLHPTPGHGPRPPHHPLGRRRRHRPVEPGPALRPPPPILHHTPWQVRLNPTDGRAGVPPTRQARRTPTHLDPHPPQAGVSRARHQGAAASTGRDGVLNGPHLSAGARSGRVRDCRAWIGTRSTSWRPRWPVSDARVRAASLAGSATAGRSPATSTPETEVRWRTPSSRPGDSRRKATTDPEERMAGGDRTGRVALVAGATRGAGRAIAVELARSGMFVYATGRSSRVSGPSDMDRPETIEETGDLIAAAGGDGSALRVDHLDVEAVRRLVDRIRHDQGRLDVLVNDIFGGDRYAQWDKPLWEHDLVGGLRMLRMGVETHIVTSAVALPLMLETGSGLLVEMTDGTSSVNAQVRAGVGFYYDFVKASVDRLVQNLTHELADHPVTALGVTPGWLRSERMLEHFGVTEATWRDACDRVPGFAISESPAYVARGVASLADDPERDRFAGRVLTARQLADEYGVTDADGSRPDCWGLIAEHGWDDQEPAVISRYR